jgi:hypothetical protein
MRTQPTKVNFRLNEPEALADFLHVEGTRLAPRAHFCRLCLCRRHEIQNSLHVFLENHLAIDDAHRDE